MKRLIVFIPLFLLIGSACQQTNNSGAATPVQAPILSRTQVVAGMPAFQSLQESLTMNAVTTYTNRENIRATTTGYIQKTEVELGHSVKSGQSLFILKTKEAEALGEEILKEPDINITGIIPIKAKNAGIITQVFFQDGDYVAEGEVLAELTKPSSLAVKLYVPFEYGQQVKLQKRVQVRLPDGETLNGVIRQLLPSEEVVSQTTPYLVTLTPFRFLPENLNVTVTVPTQFSAQALVVPPMAVQSNEEQTEFWVMQIVSDTLAIRYPINIGMRTDSLIELKNSTLQPTDRIIVQGAYGLPDTAAITLVKQL